MNRIQSQNHKVRTNEINKFSISCSDVKMFILNNKYDFFFSLYKMVESEKSTVNYKTLKISIGALIKITEMLNPILIALRLKRCVKMQLRSCRL